MARFRIDLLDEHAVVVHESAWGDRDSRLALVDSLFMCCDEAVSFELMNVETGRCEMAGLRAKAVA